MYHGVYTACCKKSVWLFTLIAAILIIHTSANAQSRYNPGASYGDDASGWGLSLGTGYDVPTGYLATTYKGSPNLAVSIINNYSDFTFNVSVGYVSYKPKLDTFYNNNTNISDGYVKYNNFNAIQFYVGAAYNFTLTDDASLYVGVNLGSYITHFSYNATDALGNLYSAKSTDGNSYVAPKIGVNFMLDDHLSLGIEAKYNFLFSSSPSTGNTYDYGYGYTTSLLKTYSGNIVLAYNF